MELISRKSPEVEIQEKKLIAFERFQDYLVDSSQMQAYNFMIDGVWYFLPFGNSYPFQKV